MRDELRPAIEALQVDVGRQERELIETKKTVNRLCEMAGMAPAYPDTGEVTQAAIASIRADTFYGKVMHTAAREYLDMRKAAGAGPATPREIYENLKKGGFAFDTKVEANAITGLRATLRKNSGIFHRLPGGEYGLLSWYPKAKAPKAASASTSDEDNDEDDSEAELEADAPEEESSNASVIRLPAPRA